MKTTVDVPGGLLQQAKAMAAEQGIPLKDLVADALRFYLSRRGVESSAKRPSAPIWISAFGGLRDLQKETQRINRILGQEFEQIEE